MAQCSQLLWEQGLAAPRTCMVCGLGPCRRVSQDTSYSAVDAVIDIVEDVVEIAAAIDIIEDIVDSSDDD